MALFIPKLFEALRGYNRRTFSADLSAGLTVGFIALPLAIGFGIASGVTPAQGLWTAIIAGFLISAFGGSKVQIGGPTGAFVPILAGIVFKFGYSGLAVATMMAGVILILMGMLRLGALIKFIPYPVIAGFTSGIAVIIAVGQIKEFLGLDVNLPEHTPMQAATLAQHLSQTNALTLGVGMLSLAILIVWPRFKRLARIPASIVAIIVPTVLVVVFHLEAAGVRTIGSKFNGIPAGLPKFALPALHFSEVQQLLLPALTIAMLGAIESLLSAMVADGLTESRHDSNQELIGQGIANLCSPLFGGISATGAIARTAANIRSGGRTPISGIIHALTLLLIVLLAAGWAAYIPLTALSAVLFFVAFRMGEWGNFVELSRGTKSDFGVLVTTFALTVVFDLTIAVGVGLLLAAALFVRRMEEITHIRLVTPDDIAMAGEPASSKDVPEGVVVFRIEGPFFFGAAEKLETAIGRYATKPRVVVFRVRNVPAIDASGLHALEIVFEKFHRRGIRLVLSGVQPQPMKVLYRSGFAERLGIDNIRADIDSALQRARQLLAPEASMDPQAPSHPQ